MPSVGCHTSVRLCPCAILTCVSLGTNAPRARHLLCRSCADGTACWRRWWGTWVMASEWPLLLRSGPSPASTLRSCFAQRQQ